jgi:hypothetical protein
LATLSSLPISKKSKYFSILSDYPIWPKPKSVKNPGGFSCMARLTLTAAPGLTVRA